MSIIYWFDNPPNTYDASYGDPISVVEDHEEDTNHEGTTNGHQQVHPPETQKQYPPETKDAPMPTDTQTTNNQGHVQEDEVGDSQDPNITHTKENTKVQ